MTKIQTTNCAFGSSVVVNETQGAIDTSRINLTTGRGTKFVPKYKSRPFELFVKLYTSQLKLGKKLHVSPFSYNHLVNKGLRKI